MSLFVYIVGKKLQLGVAVARKTDHQHCMTSESNRQTSLLVIHFAIRQFVYEMKKGNLYIDICKAVTICIIPKFDEYH